MIRIGIIDTIGLTYDGDTLSKRGLGGSESAVILISKELANLGFDVTVFNNCIDSQSSEGVFDGVRYIDHTSLDKDNDYTFDVVISSRTVIPFIVPFQYQLFADLKPERYAKIKQNCKHKVVWMHDTFCRGDEILEELLVNKQIDEIFTLSDWHTAYVTNCDHGRKRMFEVLKDKVFLTRNGITKYIDDVDVSNKDPFLYVYNASVTKGMLPLVNDIWHKIKEQVPQAKLKVIGGYYRFRENAAPDEQEKTWRQLIVDPKFKDLDVEFTGIITQKQIASILAEASYMVYPGAFPETFGISSLESLAYNTPLITTKFGALEETAVEQACYHINYPIEPNGLFPLINKEQQVQDFVATAVRASQDKYLHQQKMYYCNIVKDICTWDTVALQWKQHLYHKIGAFLPVDEYRKVSEINSRVRKVFGRRFTNQEENYIPRKPQQRILVVTPVYNAEQYIEKCIESVQSQDYDNWKMIIVDDVSTDNTYELAKKYESDNIVVYRNKENQGAVFNQFAAILEHGDQDDIVMLLDGDDWLVNDNQIFHFYNNLYDGTTEFSYGSCWSLVDNIPLIAQHYPESVKQSRSYREHKFNWNMPYTHLRTFKCFLMSEVRSEDLQDENGKFYKAGGDGALFYRLIELAEPEKVKVVSDVVYVYNDRNPLNDYKVNGEEQTKNANSIIKKKSDMKKILIAIPTAKNIESKTFKSIYDLKVPEGYETELQFFYGYQVDQVRNLIADWAKKYDYLFSVDSDIAFSSDTLEKLLSHDKDIVSGMYIQRKPGQQILELYRNGKNVNHSDIKGQGLVEVDSCGFGCVLIKSQVFKDIEYPHFEYHSALDHNNTISEDTVFCIKAKSKGYKVYADTSILCEHIGSCSFIIEDIIPSISNFERLLGLSNTQLLPKTHVNYLNRLKNEGVEPKIIYDIGACVLHWTREAINVWNDARFYAFDAMDDSADIFNYFNIPHQIGLLSSEDGKEIDFYENTENPGGNSYYIETTGKFNESHIKKKISRTLDSIVEERGFPLPDLIKMDVQGAEVDVLKGARKTLEQCNHLILELQRVEYNKGAPLKDEAFEYLESIGFVPASPVPFSDNGPDGDYHFIRK